MRARFVNESYNESTEIYDLARNLLSSDVKKNPIKDLVDTSKYPKLEDWLNSGVILEIDHTSDQDTGVGYFNEHDNRIVLYAMNSNDKDLLKTLAHELLHGFDFYRSDGNILGRTRKESDKKYYTPELHRFIKNPEYDLDPDSARGKKLNKDTTTAIDKAYYNTRSEADAFFHEAMMEILDNFKSDDYSDPAEMRKAYKMFMTNFGVDGDKLKYLNPKLKKHLQKRFLKYYNGKFLN